MVGHLDVFGYIVDMALSTGYPRVFLGKNAQSDNFVEFFLKSFPLQADVVLEQENGQYAGVTTGTKESGVQ